jgi:DNA-binding transcriptional regulator YdaS (Cro superfamily)
MKQMKNGVTNDKTQVNNALDQLKNIFALRSDRQLAAMFDVEKQNVAAWRHKGEVPPMRAIQIEHLTNGEMTWRTLCPSLLRETLELVKK